MKEPVPKTNSYIEAFEVEVQPAIMPTVNWSGISVFFRGIGIDDPVKRLDKLGVKTTDPNSINIAFDTSDHTVLGFVVVCQAEVIETLFKYRLLVDIVGTVGSRRVLLVSGSVSAWKYAILLGCQPDRPERKLFNHVFACFELTTLKKIFPPCTRRSLPDDSFYLMY